MSSLPGEQVLYRKFEVWLKIWSKLWQEVKYSNPSHSLLKQNLLIKSVSGAKELEKPFLLTVDQKLERKLSRSFRRRATEEL